MLPKPAIGAGLEKLGRPRTAQRRIGKLGKLQITICCPRLGLQPTTQDGGVSLLCLGLAMEAAACLGNPAWLPPFQLGPGGFLQEFGSHFRLELTTTITTTTSIGDLSKTRKGLLVVCFNLPACNVLDPRLFASSLPRGIKPYGGSSSLQEERTEKKQTTLPQNRCRLER